MKRSPTRQVRRSSKPGLPPKEMFKQVGMDFVIPALDRAAMS